MANHDAAPFAGTDFIPLNPGPLPEPFTGAEAPSTEPALVIAQGNRVGVPRGVLGVYKRHAPTLTDEDFHGIDWYLDGPGQPTYYIMHGSEFRTIEEG